MMFALPEDQDGLDDFCQKANERIHPSPLPRARVKDLSAAFEWLRGMACGDSLGIPSLQFDQKHAQVLMDEICRLNGVENGDDTTAGGSAEHGRRVEERDSHVTDTVAAQGVDGGVGRGQIGVE